MPITTTSLRWGILGLGNIAHQFAKDLLLLRGHTITAVASRDAQKAQGYTLQILEHTTKVSLPTLGKGLTYEMEECRRCIRSGKLESELWSQQNSLELIEILDEIREQIGLKYPFE